MVKTNTYHVEVNQRTPIKFLFNSKTTEISKSKKDLREHPAMSIKSCGSPNKIVEIYESFYNFLCLFEGFFKVLIEIKEDKSAKYKIM